MSRALARALLQLYPMAYRRRYGEEMRALLDQTPVRAMTLADLLRGALAAHLRPAAAALSPADRVRASASAVLACWVAFAAAGFGFYKTTEGARFAAIGTTHPLLGDAHLAVQALAIGASGAVVLGALPLIAAALAQARRQPRLRMVLMLPILAVLVFAVLTALLVLVAHSQGSDHPNTVGGGAFIVWGLAGLGCGALCVAASRRALFSVSLGPPRLLIALLCSSLVSAAMIAIALAGAVYAIALQTDASNLAATPNGPLGVLSTGSSLIGQLGVMVLAGTLAAITTRRGWRVAGA